jgi:hypothetical protein
LLSLLLVLLMLLPALLVLVRWLSVLLLLLRGRFNDLSLHPRYHGVELDGVNVAVFAHHFCHQLGVRNQMVHL